MKRPFSRVILIVLDSVGIGELPDAAAYGDEGSNTLGNIAKQVPLQVPTLRSLGLGELVTWVSPGTRGLVLRRCPSRIRSAGLGADRTGFHIRGAYGRMAEASPGKDSVTGHWEMMGIVLDRPFPTFPDGFPPDVDRRSSSGASAAARSATSSPPARRSSSGSVPSTCAPASRSSTRRPTACSRLPRTRTSIPIAELYRICEIAFDLVGRGMGVGRVIARPFVGAPGSFKRTANRHDYALEPTGETLLDVLTRDQTPIVSIGKVHDLFAGRGIGPRAPHGERRRRDGPRRRGDARYAEGLVFANLVDFDMLYGHRNDVAGYAANLERFDARLAPCSRRLRETDLLVVTADHGNDPTTPSTDHSREYVPLLLTGARVAAGADLGTRRTFADLGQTLAANFGVGPLAHGTSFLEEIVVQHS